MAGKKIVTLGYILVFWGVLPGVVAALAAWGEGLLGKALALPDVRWAAVSLTAVFGALLAVSIVQFTRAAGGLPISAFPPRRLIRSGLFGVWRHPIYLFAVLFFSAAAMIFWPAGSLVVALPVLTLGTVLYAGMEERGLAARFGPAYEGHRKQTGVVLPRLPRLIRPLTRLLARGFCRFEVAGRENAELEPPYFLVSAHRDYLDPFFVSLALDPPVHFIATFEMFRRPVSRFAMTRLFSIPKRRYRPDLRNALEIRRRLAEGSVIGLFPEAERSWSGGALRFKPEAVKLLLRRPDVPILPVRLEGTYAVWPRWARRPRAGKVKVIFERPSKVEPGEGPTELEARLARLIGPKAEPERRPGPFKAKGIESLIYRCPKCLGFDTVRSGRGAAFGCAACGTQFRLFSDLSIQWDGDKWESLAGVFWRIREGSADAAATADPRVLRTEAELSIESLGKLRRVGPGVLSLLSGHLAFESDAGTFRLDLASVRSVLIEGAVKLHVYAGRPAFLYQFLIRGQSALKWQGLVVDRARQVSGAAPSTA